MDGGGGQTARNVYGLNLLKRQAGSDSFTYMYNGHGDVTALLDQSGAIAVQYYYDAFGVVTEETASVNNPFRYSGYEYDSGSGLYYLKSRHYDPAIARFMQEDTHWNTRNGIYGDNPIYADGSPVPDNNAMAQSLNRYTYVNNQPTIYQDPNGQFLLPIIASIVVGVVAVSNIVKNNGGASGGKNTNINNQNSNSSSGIEARVIN